MEYNKLILIDNKDKTEEINSIASLNSYYQVCFKNSTKTYNYNNNRIKVYQLIKKCSPQDYCIQFNTSQYAPIKYLLDYSSFYKIIFQDNKSKLYLPSEISIQRNSLSFLDVATRFNYLKEVAASVGLETEDKNLLAEQFNKITELSEETIAAKYLSDNTAFTQIPLPGTLIYPFGINQSQKLAVENAFSSQVSVIQGPPGTGKTQTILTILANIICQGKNVAIVSNNNAATQNVVDKLQSKELSFITAFLGSSENKNNFLKKQEENYPNFSEWELTKEKKQALRLEITQLTKDIDQLFNAKNKLAIIEQEILALTPEQFYFNEYYTSTNQNTLFSFDQLSVKTIHSLWLEFEKYASFGKNPNFFQKIYLFFKYNAKILKLFSFSPEQIIPSLQKEFYQAKLRELTEEK